MGCDIHLYHERRLKGSQEWEPTFGVDPGKRHDQLQILQQLDPEGYERVSALPLEALESGAQRYYYAFAAMGMDSRVSVKTTLYLKGLPDDTSLPVQTASDYWGSDGHSHSWLTLKEMKEACARDLVTHQQGLADFLFHYMSTLQELETDTQPEYEHRIVFWFDS